MDLIIFFDVANETLVSRLMGRAAVSQRADDNEETIKKRIEIFNTKNGQIVDHYKDKVVTVNVYLYKLLKNIFFVKEIYTEIFHFFQIKAEKSVDEVFGEVTRALEKLLQS